MIKQALLIGINGYAADSGLASLRYAERDAVELGRVLAERCGFAVRTLLGAEATSRGMQKAMHELPGGETFVFFFAGHGQEIRGQYCLQPVDSTASGIGAIPLETLSRHWRYDFGFEKILAVLDACRNEFNWSSASHRGAARGFHSSRDIEMATHGERLVEVLYGCSDGEVSYEEQELGHGLFTDSLLKVLRQHDGELDSQSLSNKANDLMRDWCRRHGQGRMQRAKRYCDPSEQHRIVLLEGKGAATANHAPHIVPCPLCGRKNEMKETFLCRGCGLDDLCLQHQDKTSFLCPNCEDKRRQEKVKQERSVEELRRAEEAESQARARKQEEEKLTRLEREGPFGKIWQELYTGMEFVWAPGGSFQMGDTFSEGGEDELPVHEVSLSGFYLGRYAVTQGEYTKVMGKNPSRFKKGDRYPVEKVSWHDAQAFTEKLNTKGGQKFRLPTEAEWEYAAREGGKKVRFATGKDTIGPDVANFNGRSNYTQPYSRKGEFRQETVAVDSFAANSLGLYNMSGNVREWCEDWSEGDYYKNSPKANPTGPSSGSYRVNRGGSWNNRPDYLRAAFRNCNLPDEAGNFLGFRLVLPVQRP